jgi:hypothetical protein
VQAVEDSLAQFDAGQGIPLADFKRRLSEKHGLPD